MIYVLLLEQGKVYVGYSERPVGERFLEHFNYNGSKWTSLYRPVQVLQYRDGGRQEEDALTLDMMEKYGWWNVRGGSWCQVEMQSCPPALLQRQQIRMPTPLNRPMMGPSQVRGCSRCGRSSHSAESCYATTTLVGDDMFDSEDSSSEDGDICYRCGRDTHWAQNCFARTDVHGHPL